MTQVSNTTGTAVTLPATFDIQQVVTVQKAMLSALDAHGRLDIDGTAVRRTDAAGMQLLAAAARDAGQRRAPLTLASSEAIDEAARVLGLTTVLGMTPA